MIIEHALRWLRTAGIVLGLWLLVLLALPFVGPAGRTLAVTGDNAAAFKAVQAAGGSVIAIRNGVLLARGDEAGFALRLYRAGAPLVLEGRIAAGCFSSSERRLARI